MGKRTRRSEPNDALSTLETTIRITGKMDTYVQVRLPRREDPVEVLLGVAEQTVYLNVHGKRTKKLALPINLRGERDAAVSLMNDLAGDLGRGKVELESGVARGTDSDMDEAEFMALYERIDDEVQEAAG